MAIFASTPSNLALCIIGDEVLGGKTRDTNSHYVAEKAFTLGLDLKEIRVIRDDNIDIAKTVNELSRIYDIVFTSGGIGPTHDDRTYESIAKAFDKKLICSPEIGERIKGKLKVEELSQGHLKMCTIPEPDEEIIYTKGIWQPIVCVKNVYIFPGVPAFFTRMFDTWCEAKSSSYRLFPKRRIRLKTELKESAISQTLDSFHKQATEIGWSIGSHPKTDTSANESWVELSLVGPNVSGYQYTILQHIIDDIKTEYNAVNI